ncbi:MAG: lysophospholipase L1-like esterase [Parasphingorhabdus sp.]|jgi:lysophospholipase L1-like esterase
MSKDWLLSSVVTVITLVAAIFILRWYAPALLGISNDIQMVRTSKEIPSFYDNIFRLEDYTSSDFILSDPEIVNRAKPLYPEERSMGPNDILGFRNRSIPNVADIITIGDSQTYGNNAPIELNWPGQLKSRIGEITQQNQPVIYNMSVGAWGATNYLEIMRHAVHLKPKIVIVAFYTGNDPLSDFRNAYTYEKWKILRPDNSLSVEDTPNISYPVPQSEWWAVEYKDGIKTTFTPKMRYASNIYQHPAIRAAYKIIENAAREIRNIAVEHHIIPVFTIIPTKELVYAVKTEQENIEILPDYMTLVNDEQKNIDELSRALIAIPDSIYIDVVKPLQNAALSNRILYPENINGHPVANGYDVIATAIAKNIAASLPKKHYGLIGLKQPNGSIVTALNVPYGKYIFSTADILHKNGWKSDAIHFVSGNSYSRIPTRGVIRSVNSSEYGPEVFEKNIGNN